MLAARVVVGLVSAGVVVWVVVSAVRTVILPRAAASVLTRGVVVLVWVALGLRLGRSQSYERRDAVYASLGPAFLLCLVSSWLVLVWSCFAGVLWAVYGSGPHAFGTSASSLTTLGFDRPPGTGGELLVAVEALVGLALLALMLSYLPALYSAFSRRERHVSKLSARAGLPPSGVELLDWSWRFDRFEDLVAVWRDWEDSFTDLGESHTSFSVLAFFRSQHPGHSWLTASGAVLDGAALLCSAVEGPRQVDAELCIRAGYLALRGIAGVLGMPYEDAPDPSDPITIVREEFEEACEVLAASGVPLRADRDVAWTAFRGWRVNYDLVLVQLAAVVMAPYAPWSSDRSVSSFRRPRLFLLPGRHRPLAAATR